MGVGCAGFLLAHCVANGGGLGDAGSEVTTADGVDVSDDGPDDAATSGSTCVPPAKAVDILFVVDNSWSMGEEQGALSRSFAALMDPLAAEGFDVRAAVTSSDNPHPSCLNEERPLGELQRESCLDRPSDFEDPAGLMSRFNTGCQSVCKHTSQQLGLDSSAAAWIETGPNANSLPPEVSASEALACLAPSGLSGCGFEAPLEAAHAALSGRGGSPPDFIRDEAVLAVVFVTDEADCSINHLNAAAPSAFDRANSTFWTDPNQGPNSSICWNAGIQCTGTTGGIFDTCDSVDRGADGQFGVAPEMSVLHSMARYRALLDELSARKTLHAHGGRPVVALIGGVGADGTVTYAADLQSDHTRSFGIEPGCTGRVMVLDEIDPLDPDLTVPGGLSSQFAVPPVRLLELVRDYTPVDQKPPVFSICQDDYSEALGAVADRIVQAAACPS